MLVVVRHGNTPFLNGEKKIEGWGAIPLDKKGFHQADKTGDELKKLNLKFDSFHSSDLLRAKQTSDRLSEKIGMKYNTDPKLRTLNPGIFEGRSVDTHIKNLNSYIDSPHEEIPGSGRTYSDFYNTVKPLIKSRVEDAKTHLITTHNRVITLIKALAKNHGAYPDMNVLHGKGPIDPGGIMIVHPNWKVDTIDSKSDETKGE